MKKLISLGLVSLCGIMLASCGNSFEDSVNEQSQINSSKTEISNEKYKEMFIDLSDSFVSINSNMLIDDATAVEKSVNDSIKLSNKIKKQLKNGKENISKDLYKYASVINDLAVSVKNEKFDDSTEISVKIGESIGNISKNYFDGFIPESINNMLDKKSDDESKENTDSTVETDITQREEASSSSEARPIEIVGKFDSSKLDFLNFTVEPKKAKIYKKGQNYYVDLELNWINNSFDDKTTFMTATAVDVKQNNEMLSETTNAWSDTSSSVYFPNAKGGLWTVKLTYSLKNGTDPISMTFVPMNQNDTSQTLYIK